MVFALVVLLVVAAVFGGIAVNPFLWLLLVAAVFAAVFATPWNSRWW